VTGYKVNEMTSIELRYGTTSSDSNKKAELVYLIFKFLSAHIFSNIDNPQKKLIRLAGKTISSDLQHYDINIILQPPI
jgi:hypothetical protein